MEIVRWDDILIDLNVRNGREPSPGPKLEAYFKDAGFVNVTARKVPLPVGPWAKDPKQVS
jgi:hypothetical protein